MPILCGPLSSPLAMATQGARLAEIPLETQVLVIGLIYLGTLVISRFSVQIGRAHV